MSEPLECARRSDTDECQGEIVVRLRHKGDVPLPLCEHHWQRHITRESRS